MDLGSIGITKDDIIDKAAEKLIEQMDSDGCLEDALRNKVIDQCLHEARQRIETVVSSVAESLVDTPYNPVDEWGRPARREPTTIRDLISEKMMRVMEEKVDSSGRSGGYEAKTPRAEWIIKKIVDESLNHEAKTAITKAVSEARSQVQAKVAAFLAEQILKSK